MGVSSRKYLVATGSSNRAGQEPFGEGETSAPEVSPSVLRVSSPHGGSNYVGFILLAANDAAVRFGSAMSSHRELLSCHYTAYLDITAPEIVSSYLASDVLLCFLVFLSSGLWFLSGGITVNYRSTSKIDIQPSTPSTSISCRRSGGQSLTSQLRT